MQGGSFIVRVFLQTLTGQPSDRPVFHPSIIQSLPHSNLQVKGRLTDPLSTLLTSHTAQNLFVYICVCVCVLWPTALPLNHLIKAGESLLGGAALRKKVRNTVGLLAVVPGLDSITCLIHGSIGFVSWLMWCMRRLHRFGSLEVHLLMR